MKNANGHLLVERRFSSFFSINELRVVSLPCKPASNVGIGAEKQMALEIQDAVAGLFLFVPLCRCMFPILPVAVAGDPNIANHDHH